MEIFSFAKYKSLTYLVLFLILRQLFWYSFLIIFFSFPIVLAQKYVHKIAEVIHEKVAAIIVSKDLIAILSDGSQARKSSNEKELILKVEFKDVEYQFTSLFHC